MELVVRDQLGQVSPNVDTETIGVSSATPFVRGLVVQDGIKFNSTDTLIPSDWVSDVRYISLSISTDNPVAGTQVFEDLSFSGRPSDPIATSFQVGGVDVFVDGLIENFVISVQSGSVTATCTVGDARVSGENVLAFHTGNSGDPLTYTVAISQVTPQPNIFSVDFIPGNNYPEVNATGSQGDHIQYELLNQNGVIIYSSGWLTLAGNFGHIITATARNDYFIRVSCAQTPSGLNQVSATWAIPTPDIVIHNTHLSPLFELSYSAQWGSITFQRNLSLQVYEQGVLLTTISVQEALNVLADLSGFEYWDELRLIASDEIGPSVSPDVAWRGYPEFSTVSTGLLVDADATGSIAGNALPILSYVWRWDAFNSGVGIHAFHTYQQGGIYPILLEITDENGDTSTIEFDSQVI